MRTGLTATVRGLTTDISDHIRYLFIADEGLGMAPLHRIVERGPNQHGETDLGFRLDPRIINLVIGLFGEDDGDYWDAREELLGIFTPTRFPITLTFTLPNGKVRAIDVHVEKDMALPSGNRRRIAHNVGVQLRGSEPTFYDPTLQSIAFGLGGAAAPWSIPMAVPTPVGKTSIDQVRTFTYPGSFLSNPVIKITGPITNPKVINITTGETLDLTGITISAGDFYEIDTRFGKKTVLDAAGVNRYDKVAGDLSTFHLAGNPEALGGLNDLRVSGSGITAATEIYLSFYLRYVGI